MSENYVRSIRVDDRIRTFVRNIPTCTRSLQTPLCLTVFKVFLSPTNSSLVSYRNHSRNFEINAMWSCHNGRELNPIPRALVSECPSARFPIAATCAPIYVDPIGGRLLFLFSFIHESTWYVTALHCCAACQHQQARRGDPAANKLFILFFYSNLLF